MEDGRGDVRRMSTTTASRCFCDVFDSTQRGFLMTEEKKRASAFPLRGSAPGLFLFLFSFLIYANTIGHDYAVDDKVVILENTFTRIGVRGIPGLVCSDSFAGYLGEKNPLSGGRYRPLSLMTFALEQELFGLNPHVSHAVNILLYACTSVLLFAVLRMMLSAASPAVAFAAALLFAAHPVHTEVVANIKSRDELLRLLFVLDALFFLLRCVHLMRRRDCARGLACYAAALFAKETSLVFVIIIPAALYVFTRISAKRLMGLSAALSAPAALFLIVRFSITGMASSAPQDIMQNPFVHAAILQRLATVSITGGEYLRLLFFPFPLVWDYSCNQIPLATWESGAAVFWAFVYAGMLLFAMLRLPRRSIAAFGALLYLAPLIPVANILFPVGSLMAERFLYMPSLGFCLVAAFALVWGLQGKKDTAGFLKNPLLAAAVCLIAVLYSVKTVGRNRDWKDNLTLFSADLEHGACNARERLSLGMALARKACGPVSAQEKQALLAAGQGHIRAALRINPCYKNAFLALSFISRLRGDARGAAGYDEKAIACDPRHAPSFLSLGISSAMAGSREKAVEQFKKALSLRPGYAEAYFWLGNEYCRAGDIVLGGACYEKALVLNPAYAEASYNLGVMKQHELKDFPGALACYNSAVKYKPDYADAHENLGTVYLLMGKYDEAISCYRRAAELNPAGAQAYGNLALVYERLGDAAAAEQYRQKALAIERGDGDRAGWKR